MKISMYDQQVDQTCLMTLNFYWEKISSTFSQNTYRLPTDFLLLLSSWVVFQYLNLNILTQFIKQPLQTHNNNQNFKPDFV